MKVSNNSERKPNLKKKFDVCSRLTQQHIRKLSSNMTPNNKYLRIPRIYHFECPWPAAQHEIQMINAYKVRVEEGGVGGGRGGGKEEERC